MLKSSILLLIIRKSCLAEESSHKVPLELHAYMEEGVKPHSSMCVLECHIIEKLDTKDHISFSYTRKLLTLAPRRGAMTMLNGLLASSICRSPYSIRDRRMYGKPWYKKDLIIYQPPTICQSSSLFPISCP
jgi:hypothetical protein